MCRSTEQDIPRGRIPQRMPVIAVESHTHVQVDEFRDTPRIFSSCILCISPLSRVGRGIHRVLCPQFIWPSRKPPVCPQFAVPSHLLALCPQVTCVSPSYVVRPRVTSRFTCQWLACICVPQWLAVASQSHVCPQVTCLPGLPGGEMPSGRRPEAAVACRSIVPGSFSRVAAWSKSISFQRHSSLTPFVISNYLLRHWGDQGPARPQRPRTQFLRLLPDGQKSGLARRP